MRSRSVTVVIVIVIALATLSARAAFGQTFTDDPVTTSTIVKGVHITEMRSAVAALRSPVSKRSCPL